jgi:two-component system response regulator BaeR
MLPGKNGIDICKEVRQFSNVPILMMTAKVEEVDRLLGLELGADDYICKPYSPREVVARVKAVLRRTQNQDKVSDKLTLDESRFVATYSDQEASLTSVEFQMLKLLNDRPNTIFNREQLMDAMYTDYRIVNNRTVDSHIKKLRKKLDDISQGEEIIQSVYGVGYRVVV